MSTRCVSTNRSVVSSVLQAEKVIPALRCMNSQLQGRGDARLDGEEAEKVEKIVLPTFPRPSAIAPHDYFTQLLSTIHDIYSLTGLVTPYFLHPIVGINIYFPDMWPFSKSVSFSPVSDIQDLSGKVILVTGGNNGLGKETILQLAKHKPEKIFMASRTEAKAAEAIKSVNASLSEPVDIEFVPLDLASLKSVGAAAQQFNSRSSRLDILILNAGIMATPPGKTEAGHDIQLGTNHVGHFLLTKLLLPTLIKTAAEPNSDVRVITVSSEAHQMAPDIGTITSTEKLCQTGVWTRYGASKAANILFAAELARRSPGLTSVSIHPGVIKTDLYQNNGALLNIVLATAGRFIMRDVPSGALNQLWASSGAAKDKLINGAYYTPVGVAYPNNKYVKDTAAAKKLWDWTESELAKAGQ